MSLPTIKIYVTTESEEEQVPVQLVRRIHDALAAAPDIRSQVRVQFDDSAAALVFEANGPGLVIEERPIEIVVTDTISLVTVHY